MSQHDLDISNQTFPNTRSDLNLALKALGSNQSGSSAPSTTFANQFFYNTTSNLLQIRNEDNDAYITLAELDQANDTVEYFKSDSVRTALIEFTDGTDCITLNGSGNATIAGVCTATTFSGAGTSLTGVTLKTSNTGSSNIPVGTTAQRDGSPSAGLLRFNSTTAGFEGYDGSAWGSIGGGSTSEILHVREEQSNTTYAGGTSAGSTVTRVLNTVVKNEITGASLSSNQFTLPAGTYFIDASAPANEVDRNRISLKNATDNSITLLGQSCAIGASISQTHARLRGKFTITGSKAFEIRHYTESARSVYGLGDYTNDGNNAIYTEVIVEKV